MTTIKTNEELGEAPRFIKTIVSCAQEAINEIFNEENWADIPKPTLKPEYAIEDGKAVRQQRGNIVAQKILPLRDWAPPLKLDQT